MEQRTDRFSMWGGDEGRDENDVQEKVVGPNGVSSEVCKNLGDISIEWFKIFWKVLKMWWQGGHKVKRKTIMI